MDEKIVLIYLRKSQADNPNESVEEVLEKHEYQLQEYAEQELGYRIAEKYIYREVVSGETIEDRVEIKKVLHLIESDRIYAVLIIEPQRLGRGDLEDCGRLVNAFRYTNTRIITPTKTYDLQDKYDRKFFEMELQRGSDYLEYYKEIQARGRLASVKRGNYIGSIAPFGYNRICIKDENGKKCWTLEENPEESPAIKMAYDLFVNKSYGFTKVANALDEAGFKPRHSKHWSPAAIKDMLENPVYIGKVRWNRRKEEKTIINGQISVSRPKAKIEDYGIYEGKHKGIISDDLFYAALARRGKNIRIKSKAKVRNPLSGLVYCQCGRAMSYRSYKRTDGTERSKPRLLCDDQVHCGTSSCLYSEIEERVLKVLRKTIKDFEIELDSFDYNKVEIISSTVQGLQKKLDALSKKELSLWDKYSEENMPKEIFETLIEKVNREKNETAKALEKAKYQVPDRQHYEKCLLTFQEALNAMTNDSIPAEQKNTLLKKCIERIEYRRDKAVIIHKGDTNEKLTPGGHWSQPEIKLDITLRI